MLHKAEVDARRIDQDLDNVELYVPSHLSLLSELLLSILNQALL